MPRSPPVPPRGRATARRPRGGTAARSARCWRRPAGRHSRASSRREDATAAAFQRTAMVPSPGDDTLAVPAPRRGGRAAVRAVVATGAVVALATGGLRARRLADLPHIPGLPGQASDRATDVRRPGPEAVGGVEHLHDPGGRGVRDRNERTRDERVGHTAVPDHVRGHRPEARRRHPDHVRGGTSVDHADDHAVPTTPSTDRARPPTPTTPRPRRARPRTSSGLCRRFPGDGPRATESGRRSTAPPSPRSSRRPASAEQVAAYCVDLIGRADRQAHRPTSESPPASRATAPGKPTDKPVTDRQGRRHDTLNVRS